MPSVGYRVLSHRKVCNFENLLHVNFYKKPQDEMKLTVMESTFVLKNDAATI